MWPVFRLPLCGWPFLFTQLGARVDTPAQLAPLPRRSSLSRLPGGVSAERANLGAPGQLDSAHRAPRDGPAVWGGGPGGWGAGPDTSSRRGFLLPPSHGLGPWPVPGNRHGARLPAGLGLSHRLPGDSCRLAQRLGAGPLLPQTGAQGLA